MLRIRARDDLDVQVRKTRARSTPNLPAEITRSAGEVLRVQYARLAVKELRPVVSIRAPSTPSLLWHFIHCPHVGHITTTHASCTGRPSSDVDILWTCPHALRRKLSSNRLTTLRIYRPSSGYIREGGKIIDSLRARDKRWMWTCPQDVHIHLVHMSTSTSSACPHPRRAVKPSASRAPGTPSRRRPASPTRPTRPALRRLPRAACRGRQRLA